MTAPSGEQALLEAARGDDGGTPLFGSRPPGRPRPIDTRRFDGSDNVPLRYEVTGREAAASAWAAPGRLPLAR